MPSLDPLEPATRSTVSSAEAPGSSGGRQRGRSARPARCRSIHFSAAEPCILQAQRSKRKHKFSLDSSTTWDLVNNSFPASDPKIGDSRCHLPTGAANFSIAFFRSWLRQLPVELHQFCDPEILIFALQDGAQGIRKAEDLDGCPLALTADGKVRWAKTT